MRESFSLFLWNKKDPRTKQRRITYYIKIMFMKYHGTHVWKMVIKDTLYDLKHL